MKKLIIDMDDVICERNFIDMVNDFLGSNYTQEEIGSYYINDIIPKNKEKEWIDFFQIIMFMIMVGNVKMPLK